MAQDDEPQHPFDVDAFLARPLNARVATNGPSVRPVWFHWEDGAFWIMTGPWTKLMGRIPTDPELALVVDSMDLTTGELLQVNVTGRGELLPWDAPRARKMLVRYLGEDVSSWPELYQAYVADEGVEGGAWLKVTPTRLVASDFSHQV